MVFSSVPPYLDRNNWHLQLQQSSRQQTGVGGAGGDETPNLSSSPVPPPMSHHGREGGGTARPGSMIDRARMLNLPIPEPGLNCPRCNSTNTKFCYYNNYNLTQPRHLCKACRRYWTRGGALRNVPVGGGCRKNKRNNKSRSSKSPNQTMPKSLNDSPSRCSVEAMANTQPSHLPSFQLPSMSSLCQHRGVGGNISSNLGGFHLQNEMCSFQFGNGSSNGHNFNNISTIGGVEHWRLPFLAGFEVPSNPNPFHYQSEGVAEEPSSLMLGNDTQTPNSRIDNSRTDHPVKTENNCSLDLSRHFVGVSEASNQQPWVGNAWTEFSGVITTSSTTPTTCFL